MIKIAFKITFNANLVYLLKNTVSLFSTKNLTKLAQVFIMKFTLYLSGNEWNQEIFQDLVPDTISIGAHSLKQSFLTSANATLSIKDLLKANF